MGEIYDSGEILKRVIIGVMFLRQQGLTVGKSLTYFSHCYRRVDRIGVTDGSRVVEFSERRNIFFLWSAAESEGVGI